MSVPGLGELGAATLIAEIGDFKDFPSGDNLLPGLSGSECVSICR